MGRSVWPTIREDDDGSPPPSLQPLPILNPRCPSHKESPCPPLPDVFPRPDLGGPPGPGRRAGESAVLWYNGNYDNRDATVNQADVPVNTGSGYSLRTTLVYDNFVVPVGQSWTITSVYSNDQIAYGATPTTATWQIRSGMSAGNGGTLVASGDSSATETALTKITGDYYGDSPYKISETVLGDPHRRDLLDGDRDSAGYYGDQSYVMTTSGAARSVARRARREFVHQQQLHRPRVVQLRLDDRGRGGRDLGLLDGGRRHGDHSPASPSRRAS